MSIRQLQLVALAVICAALWRNTGGPIESGWHLLGIWTLVAAGIALAVSLAADWITDR